MTEGLHGSMVEEPCDAEPAGAQADKLRTPQLQPPLSLFLRELLPCAYQLWLGVHVDHGSRREVSSTQFPFLFADADDTKPQLELRHVLGLSIEG